MAPQTANEQDELITNNGEMVNKAWLEYNLAQYYLPPEQRQFLPESGLYPDHEIPAGIVEEWVPVYKYAA